MSLQTLYVGNDNLIEVHGLRSVATGAYDNLAVVTMRLLDAVSRALVVGPLAMFNVGGADGVYRGVLPAATPLVEGKRYLMEVKAVGISTALWTIPMVGQHRCELE